MATEHTKVTEEVVSWECLYGECDHDVDCPTTTVEACAGCTRPGNFEDSEYTGVVLWDYAERRGHRTDA
jgi:hypothetical protein